MDSRGAKITVVLVVLCVVLGSGYVVYAAMSPGDTTTDARPQAGEVLARTDLMVRAVDPSRPSLNGRVYVLHDGKLRGAASAWACPPPGSTTPPPSSTRSCGPCIRPG
jgi:hypothetical protein